MTLTRTQLKEIDKGKILTYMETINPAKIAKNNQEKDLLMGKAKEKQNKPLHEIVNNFGLKCSLSTAANVLYNSRLHSLIAVKNLYISETHAYNWATVIFSDERSVEIGKQSPFIYAIAHSWFGTVDL
ncbi:hypothetical protein G9A89_002613 [Geosiphon pyriformis]|nr:hypothetical protein G9A89_002613 [Geosiphon pyriformis]